MAEEIIIVAPAHALMAALATASTAIAPVAPMAIRTTEPTDDGTWEMGQGGVTTASHVRVIPFSDGPAGTQFRIRVWGWLIYGTDPNTRVYLPSLLVQLTCTTGEIPGPSTPFLPRVLPDVNRCCDVLSVDLGSVGTGSLDVPGPGYLANALVEVKGAKKVQFEFEQIDPVSMNALWARA